MNILNQMHTTNSVIEKGIMFITQNISPSLHRDSKGTFMFLFLRGGDKFKDDVSFALHYYQSPEAR